MAKPHERVFALVAAVVFLATSVAFSVAVIVQIRNEGKNKQTAEVAESTENSESSTQEGKLKGTKLADFTPVSMVEELQKIDIKVGDGAEVKAGATVTAHYTGATAKDGIIFESSKDSGQPATFPLSNVIKGWQEGVPGMKVGGIRRLIIPADLAYGEQGSPPAIGPNEPLVFDIEMVSVQQ